MDKIIEYKVVIGNTPRDLENTINKMLPEGWRQEGGHVVSETYHHQAMVKLQVY